MLPSPPAPLLLLASCIWAALVAPTGAIRPKFSWDYVGNMTFIHLCNESGLFNDDALDTIVQFPLVTVEKGQGFNDGTGVPLRLPYAAHCSAMRWVSNGLEPPTLTTF